MGSLFRSKPMYNCQLMLQVDAAYNCLAELGEIGRVHFKDLNEEVNAFLKQYVNEIRRCEEMERKLRFLEKEMQKDGIAKIKLQDDPPAPPPRDLNDLENSLEKIEVDIKEVNSSGEALKTNLIGLIEMRHVLNKSGQFFDEHVEMPMSFGQPKDEASSERSQFGYVAGVINRSKFMGFERILWRICHGNVLIKQSEIEELIEDSNSDARVGKVAFAVFYQGDQLKDKIRKICEAYRASLYTCPEGATERKEMIEGLNTRIEDLNNVIEQTQQHRNKILMEVAANFNLWSVKVLKIKGIYHTLNCFNVDLVQNYLIGECWVPHIFMAEVRQALVNGTKQSNTSDSAAILNVMETKESPPTYNKTNKFTKVFQTIVNSYGVCTYREANPAPFAIISFPFLFSMMFGDAGHGSLVFFTALVVVLFEKKILKSESKNEIWNIFFGGRYIVLLMGMFSIYAGFVYNDIFSKSSNIFGSSWYPAPKKYNETTVLPKAADFTLNPNSTDYYGYPYAFGMDPVWQLSLNKITFLNSFKMKISVVFGVSQMTFGILLSLTNHVYFKDPVNIFCEFIPEMLFIMSMFGYLIVLVFYKWIAYSAKDASCAPSLLIDLINMFLLNYPDDPCSSLVFYPHQKTFQFALVVIVALCVPWLLFPKPFILRRRHRLEMEEKNRKKSSLSGDMELQGTVIATGGTETDVAEVKIGMEDPPDDKDVRSREKAMEAKENEYETIESENKGEKSSVDVAMDGDRKQPTKVAPRGGGLHGEEEFNFGDIFVHQAIHTIEFCLGCISHTASYLRLWALSLAHAELSEVLWAMVLHIGLIVFGDSYLGVLGVFLTFAPWAVLTVAILLLMEGLSAFLHTLRLHWVEFQSKFYKGEGYIFHPFSFRKLKKQAAAA